eukprot:scpid37883/ scgid3891/ 
MASDGDKTKAASDGNRTTQSAATDEAGHAALQEDNTQGEVLLAAESGRNDGSNRDGLDSSSSTPDSLQQWARGKLQFDDTDSASSEPHVQDVTLEGNAEKRHTPSDSPTWSVVSQTTAKSDAYNGASPVRRSPTVTAVLSAAGTGDTVNGAGGGAAAAGDATASAGDDGDGDDAAAVGEAGGFEGVFDQPFWEKVSTKVTLEGLPRKSALQETRVDRIVEQHGSVEKGLLWVLKQCPMQGETIRMLSGMLPRGVDLKDDEVMKQIGETALHLAAERNFVHVARNLLLYDKDAPVGQRDVHGRLPVEIAIKERHDKLAALLIKAMKKCSVRALFEVDKETGQCKICFQDLIKSGDMPETCQEVLTACISATGEPDELRFHFSLLESDRQGRTPDSTSFSFQSTTAYQRATECENKAIRHHAVVRMLTYAKWTSYGEKMALFKLFMYLVFLFCLSFSLISASRQANPAVYNSAEDRARGFFEVVTLLIMAYYFVSDMILFKRTGFEYLLSVSNSVRLLSTLLSVIIIPLRFTEVRGQWHVASITFALFWLQLLAYLSVTRFVGIYMQMLTRILVRDVSRFLVVFLTILVTYSGALVLALRAESLTGTEVPEEDSTAPFETTELAISRLTNSFGAILLTGLRSMVQQENIVDYVNEDSKDTSFSWLGIIINILFLFFLLVVLLNILIA